MPSREDYEQVKLNREQASRKFIRKAIISTVLAFLIVVATIMGGCPMYDVWQKGLAGEAELKRASWNRQIVVQEAKAKQDAAKALAIAEIERAKGIAEANKIIGDSLDGKEEYLRFLYIDMLRETGGEGRETIYVPTEAGLPILEATRNAK